MDCQVRPLGEGDISMRLKMARQADKGWVKGGAAWAEGVDKR